MQIFLLLLLASCISLSVCGLAQILYFDSICIGIFIVLFEINIMVYVKPPEIHYLILHAEYIFLGPFIVYCGISLASS